MVDIWFFVGISLAIDGAFALVAGLYQLINPPVHPDVVLFQLHANVWWGAVLLVVGLIYCVRYMPRKRQS
jgi:uncharacterized membrane protein HdeD (DUF308 family)